MAWSAGAVSSGARCARVLPCGIPFVAWKAHGIPFEAIPLAPCHVIGSEKGNRVQTKSADSWIFGEKGNNVAWPPCHFSPLGEKGRWVGWPQKYARNSLFLCLPVQIKCSLNAPMGDVNRKWLMGLQLFAVPKVRHEKLPFLGTVCRIHIAHSIHVRSGWKLAR